MVNVELKFRLGFYEAIYAANTFDPTAQMAIDILQSERVSYAGTLINKTWCVIYQTVHGAIKGTLMQSLWTSLIAHTTQSVKASRCHRNIRMSHLVSSPLHSPIALPPSICHMSRTSDIVKARVLSYLLWINIDVLPSFRETLYTEIERYVTRYGLSHKNNNNMTCKNNSTIITILWFIRTVERWSCSNF